MQAKGVILLLLFLLFVCLCIVGRTCRFVVVILIYFHTGLICYNHKLIMHNYDYTNL